MTPSQASRSSILKCWQTDGQTTYHHTSQTSENIGGGAIDFLVLWPPTALHPACFKDVNHLSGLDHFIYTGISRFNSDKSNVTPVINGHDPSVPIPLSEDLTMNIERCSWFYSSKRDDLLTFQPEVRSEEAHAQVTRASIQFPRKYRLPQRGGGHFHRSSTPFNSTRLIMLMSYSTVAGIALVPALLLRLMQKPVVVLYLPLNCP